MSHVRKTRDPLALGDLLVATVEIDRFPNGVVPAGDVLIVVEISDEVTMAYNSSRTVDGIEEWNNCIQFDVERPWWLETRRITNS
jgi:hypothetical protein